MEENELDLRLTDDQMESRAVMSQLDREGDVIAACRRGDRAAFQQLFEAYKDRVYSIAWHYSGNETTAKDITQQVFLKLFTRMEQFQGNSEFATWLHRIVATTCMDEYRSRRRFLPIGDAAEVNGMTMRDSQESRYLRREIEVSVQRAVASLNPKLRLAIVLKYIEGMSYEEIAQALGCTTGTVGSRLNR